MTVKISVVVPTYRRPYLLERCLHALLRQDLAPETYEIIVADDGADVATEQTVRALAQRPGQAALHYIAVRGRHGPAAARNRGWRRARAPIVAFTDDDCVPEPDWLRHGLARFEPDVTAVWGRLRMPLPANPTDYERDAARLQDAEFVTANCFCRRTALATTGGFDERFTAAWREDSDLFFSLLERAARVVHAPEAVVVHPIRPAPWGISVRQQRKIRFDALLYKKHPRLYRDRIRRRPPARYYTIAATLLIAITAVFAGRWALAALSGALWLALSLHLFSERLRQTSRRLAHVAEMLATSLLIPPLAVFWRLAGAIRYRVAFL